MSSKDKNVLTDLETELLVCLGYLLIKEVLDEVLDMVDKFLNKENSNDK